MRGRGGAAQPPAQPGGAGLGRAAVQDQPAGPPPAFRPQRKAAGRGEAGGVAVDFPHHGRQRRAGQPVFQRRQNVGGAGQVGAQKRPAAEGGGWQVGRARLAPRQPVLRPQDRAAGRQHGHHERPRRPVERVCGKGLAQGRGVEPGCFRQGIAGIGDARQLRGHVSGHSRGHTRGPGIRDTRITGPCLPGGQGPPPEGMNGHGVLTASLGRMFSFRSNPAQNDSPPASGSLRRCGRDRPLGVGGGGC